MELIIKIPEIMLDWLKNGYPDEDDMNELLEIIFNGTPLPKGHGRLIDADEVKEQIKGWSTYAVDKTPTIIEADKEG